MHRIFTTDTFFHIVAGRYACKSLVLPTITLAFLLFFIPNAASAARLLLSPTSGAFEVGSTFVVSILLDSEEESINAFHVKLNFPPDKLQLVSPSVGESIAAVWTGPPQYNNRTGVVELQGGIPNGITVSRGLISELEFRVKQSGNAILSFGDESEVLLNDGKGTYVLSDTVRAVFQLVLPPPAGPAVSSDTHPDQKLWYANEGVILRWSGSSGAQYSYMLSDGPIDIPDNIPEGEATGVSYKKLSSGTHYFHIKSLENGVWGGVTHFEINVDVEPPAEFPVLVSPSGRTTTKNPIVIFETTDRHSGIDHYEMKVIPLYLTGDDGEPFFIESNTREVLDLDLGSYDLIVRAYDQAANIQESVKRVKIVEPIFQLVQSRGLQLGSLFTVSWLIVIPLILISIGGLFYLGRYTKKWHHTMRSQKEKGGAHERIRKRVNKLKEYKNKYKKVGFFLIPFLFFSPFGNIVSAQEAHDISPPIITEVSNNISNEEIFYIGGNTKNLAGEVVLYLQNVQSGEVYNQPISIDDSGEWFYRHNNFLSQGDYTLWVQQRVSGVLSPPSSSVDLHVRVTAIKLGSSRISLETLYLLFLILSSVVILSLFIYIFFHIHHGRRWKKRLLEEVQEAEDALRHGFAILRRDIQAELSLIDQVKMKGALAREEAEAEKRLLEDLEEIEKNIGKEILDIEELERE